MSEHLRDDVPLTPVGPPEQVSEEDYKQAIRNLFRIEEPREDSLFENIGFYAFALFNGKVWKDAFQELKSDIISIPFSLSHLRETWDLHQDEDLRDWNSWVEERNKLG